MLQVYYKIESLSVIVILSYLVRCVCGEDATCAKVAEGSAEIKNGLSHIDAFYHYLINNLEFIRSFEKDLRPNNIYCKCC